MLTDSEFVEVVKTYLEVQPDGNITLNITDEETAKRYSEYVEHHAKPHGSRNLDTNYGCGNNYQCKPL